MRRELRSGEHAGSHAAADHMRLGDGADHRDSRADGDERHGAGGLHGRRPATGRDVRAAPAAALLLSTIVYLTGERVAFFNMIVFSGVVKNITLPFDI